MFSDFELLNFGKNGITRDNKRYNVIPKNGITRYNVIPCYTVFWNNVIPFVIPCYPVFPKIQKFKVRKHQKIKIFSKNHSNIQNRPGDPECFQNVEAASRSEC